MSEIMPKGFILPNGNAVRTRAYVASWRLLKTLPPNEEVKGWEWYATPVRLILRDISYSVHDRVNRRGGLVIRELSEKRLFKLRDKHKV